MTTLPADPLWADLEPEVQAAVDREVAWMSIQPARELLIHHRQAVAPRIIADALLAHSRPTELIADLILSGVLSLNMDY